MVSLPKEFRASLESYTGPLDLLLYLIKKEEVDVFDIPISGLVKQYEIYLDILKDIDPNACGDFLVMAARLMEIKSKLLLPREVIDEEVEEYEDPRIELVRMLLEYKKFKERALLLESRLDWHRKRYERPLVQVPDAPTDERNLYLGNVGVWDLLTAFHKVEIAIGARAPHQVHMEDRPPEAYIQDVVGRLEQSTGQKTHFDDLFVSILTRSEACGYFLAILQLAKEYRLIIEQGDDLLIYVTLRDNKEASLLREAELEGDAEPVLTEEEEAKIAELAAEARQFRIDQRNAAADEADHIPTAEELDKLTGELGLDVPLSTEGAGSETDEDESPTSKIPVSNRRSEISDALDDGNDAGLDSLVDPSSDDDLKPDDEVDDDDEDTAE